ncbi:molybdopterin-binding protein [Botrimarina hoheduenensis]|uniref:CinA-like protein n=1 Tax=Botrimarina hoheduenensis TaxID=2528000 RepID=A0A5C5WF12_9BACT|nr:molybdopterin-binding protein [Botrimarina hoheduenensis]TWT48681.1 putative competence-damage inducible protein [Botrimarina hoheduenensis]
MRGEVIAIGDELTTGQRLDTNTQWLSQRLTELGVEIVAHTTVADDLALNRDAFLVASRRADLVVSTGGLGPTADDLTRDALALAAGVELVTDPETVERLEALFRSRGREMPPQNRRQAQSPAGARAIPNPGGTAPGVDFTFAETRFFALPGVPEEMREMWAATVAPAIARLTGGGRVMRHHLVKCFGVGESQLEAMLPDLIRRGREPLVGITASKATITLRITATGSSAEACFAAMTPTLEQVRQVLGDLIFAECDPEHEIDLPEALLNNLAKSKKTVATSESMTTGWLGHWLSRLDEGRGIYRGGRLYSILDTTAPCDVPSVEREALAIRTATNADYGVAVGRPTPESHADATRTGEGVPIAVAGPQGVESKRIVLVGHRSIHQSLVAKHALNVLRLGLSPVAAEVSA